MSMPQWLPRRTDVPGLGLALGVGLVALGITRALPPSPWISDVLVALLLGTLVLNTPVRRVIGLELPSGDRDPDRYAPGLRFTGKWVLRLGIILMGMKVRTNDFGRAELLLIAGAAAAAIPSTFMLVHALATPLRLRRSLADLLAFGSMICGASAVNAAAPVARARREEQGLAIGIVFVFSVFALLAFHPIATAMGLDSSLAGLWSGLAVNDLSSAIAVGAQMGGSGAVMAAAAKSTRILLLAPALVGLSLVRREGGPVSLRKSIIDALPRFLFGYIALALVRAAGDRVFGVSATWQAVLTIDKLLVDVAMLTVTAGIGLHLAWRTLFSSSLRAMALGGAASLWMASITLATVVATSRGVGAVAIFIGAAALAVSYAAYRVGMRPDIQMRALRERYESGAPLSMAEATKLLDQAGLAGGLHETFLRRILVQLHPSIGELIPIRQSPLAHGEGCRWVTYWEGGNGWALVALCRDPGSTTPIHTHPHRLLGKAIEGGLEELRFRDVGNDTLELVSRRVLGHEELVDTEAQNTLHLLRAIGQRPAIDLQFRGPESGQPGRSFQLESGVDPLAMPLGARLHVSEHVDSRPGQGGEGAAPGRMSSHA